MQTPHRLFFFVGLIGCIGIASADELLTFSILIKDGHIIPARLNVHTRKKIKLTAKNEGSDPCELENLDLRVEKVLAPRASSFVIIPSLKQRSYRFFGEFHPSTSEMLLADYKMRC